MTKGLAALLASLALGGCITDKAKTESKEEAKASLPEPSAALAEPGVPPPGLGFVYALDHGAATPPMHNCLVRFERETAGQKDGVKATVEARLTPEANRILVKVPAGSYRLVSASCDNGRKFVLPKLPLVPVAADQVTFLGEVKLIQSMASKKVEKDTLQLDHAVKESTQETYADFQKRGLKLLWWKP